MDLNGGPGSDYAAALLAVLLHDSEILSLLPVTAADFERPLHRSVFSAIEWLVSSSRPVTTLTIAEELERRGELARLGGMAAVAALDDPLVPKSAPVDYYAAEISKSARERRAKEILSRAQLHDVDEERLLEIVRDASEELSSRHHEIAVQDLYGADVHATSPSFTVSNLVRQKGLHLLWAAPGTGKTWLLARTMHELLLEALPDQLFGHPQLTVHGGYKRILWIATEEDLGTLRGKCDMILRGLGVERLAGQFSYVFAADARRRITLDDLPALLEHTGPYDAVVLDSLTGLRPKVVNGQRVRWDVDNDAANEQCLILRGLAEKHRIAIWLVHHTGRDQTRGYRGPTDWWASADVQVGFVAEDENLVRVQIEKNRDGTRLEPFLLKMAWGPEGFYVEHAGEASGVESSPTPAELKADEYLRDVGEASQLQIMEACGIKSRQTMSNIVRRRIELGGWVKTGAAIDRSPVLCYRGSACAQ